MSNITSSTNSNPHVKINSDCVSGSESGWVEIRRGNHKPKLQNNIPRCLKQLAPSTFINNNKFTPLTIVQEEDSQQPFQASNMLRTTQTTDFHVNKRRKVILLGDSHIRGCSKKLADILGDSYSVIGLTKPNANIEAIAKTTNLNKEKLPKSDIMIFCGGTRDISKNEAKPGLKSLSQFVNSTNNTNMIVMCAPTRFDL